MAKQNYVVNRAFGGELEGKRVFFTRENAHRVSELPAAKREELVKAGTISEVDKAAVAEPEAPKKGTR
jgi:hypothetical protein